jgi:hypothetical protein
MDLEPFLLENEYCWVELFKNSSGHFELTAKINGIEGNFILDTGASNTCIATDSKEKFELNLEESQVRAAGAGSIDMETHETIVEKFEIGESSTKFDKLVVFDLKDINTALERENSNKIDGIIGGDILEEKRAIISYHEKKLFLKK